MIAKAPDRSYIKITVIMQGFDEEAYLLVQPKDEWIDHKENTPTSPTKLYKAVSG